DLQRGEPLEGRPRGVARGPLEDEAAQILHASSIGVRPRPAPRQAHTAGRVGGTEVADGLRADIFRWAWQRLPPPARDEDCREAEHERQEATVEEVTAANFRRLTVTSSPVRRHSVHACGVHAYVVRFGASPGVECLRSWRPTFCGAVPPGT